MLDADGMILKVLLVENDLFVRLATAESFEKAGAEVLQANSTAEAWAILQADPAIGLVFCDVGSPEVRDGFALAEAARRLKPSLSIVLTSAISVEDQGFALLLKPYNELDIEMLVARHGTGGSPPPSSD